MSLHSILLCCLMALSATLHAAHSIKIPLADGFDFPVGKPDAAGYYTARGYYPNGHLGEDWNGTGGGNTDLGDPVYATADGVVVFSEDYYRGWGNVVIIRHALNDPASGKLLMIDSLYGHLDKRSVSLYQIVKRGQLVGTIGTAHGKYWAHLHFEMRKNLKIGMQRNSYPRDYSCYYSPKVFIKDRRKLKSDGYVSVPVNTFSGQGGSDWGPEKSPELVRETKEEPKPEMVRRAIPVRGDAGADASADERRRRELALQKLVEENRKKVEAIKDEDMDAFWSRLKTQLGDKDKKK